MRGAWCTVSSRARCWVTARLNAPRVLLQVVLIGVLALNKAPIAAACCLPLPVRTMNLLYFLERVSSRHAVCVACARASALTVACAGVLQYYFTRGAFLPAEVSAKHALQVAAQHIDGGGAEAESARPKARWDDYEAPQARTGHLDVTVDGVAVIRDYLPPSLRQECDMELWEFEQDVDGSVDAIGVSGNAAKLQLPESARPKDARADAAAAADALEAEGRRGAAVPQRPAAGAGTAVEAFDDEPEPASRVSLKAAAMKAAAAARKLGGLQQRLLPSAVQTVSEVYVGSAARNVVYRAPAMTAPVVTVWAPRPSD